VIIVASVERAERVICARAMGSRREAPKRPPGPRADGKRLASPAALIANGDLRIVTTVFTCETVAEEMTPLPAISKAPRLAR